MKKAQYLGDAVYIQPDVNNGVAGGFIMTTDTHVVSQAGNRIYLDVDVDVVKALLEYLKPE